MNQQTLSDIEYSNRRKKTRREEFLGSMDQIIPWDHWIGMIRKYDPSGKRSRPTRGIETMLRMYLMQNRFCITSCFNTLIPEDTMDIKESVLKMKKDNNFIVKPPMGLPCINKGHFLPEDVKEFYSICGGIECYKKTEAFPVTLLSPEKVKPANLELFGKEFQEDRSSSWYLIADAEDSNYLTIDFSAQKKGRCYESFEYSHAAAGNCPVIALSFSELIENLMNYKGDYFYWKEADFAGYGDAYDG